MDDINDGSIHRWVDELIGRCVDGSKGEWVAGDIGGWVDMHRCMDQWMEG